MVGVEIAHHQGVTTKVPFEEGGQVGRETGWTGGDRWDVDVYYCYFGLIDIDGYCLVLRGEVASEEGVGLEGKVRGVFPNEEG